MENQEKMMLKAIISIKRFAKSNKLIACFYMMQLYIIVKMTILKLISINLSVK